MTIKETGWMDENVLDFVQSFRLPLYGKVIDVVGNLVYADLSESHLGSMCEISVSKNKTKVLCEVVGFRHGHSLLMPYGPLSGIKARDLICVKKDQSQVFLSQDLIGGIFDSLLQPLGSETLKSKSKIGEWCLLEGSICDPLLRARIHKPIAMGIRAIDSLLTMGEGQRLGILAGTGVGKSVLLGSIARGCSSDVNVIALIGERGREVREFIENDLGEEGLKRSVVIVVTSDQSPLLRIRGAKLATTIAEYFSRQGRQVLLMMDSLTRVAQAQREIGLAVGEPPTTKGYPPSVFSLLPRLLERCGPQKKESGSISALFSVLVDGDDFNDPIPDAARGILDGHIVLTRELAEKQHFPAIDINKSISRLMKEICNEEHLQMAGKIKSLIAEYQANLDLIQIGQYRSGQNQELDLAIQHMPNINRFLQQGMKDTYSFEQSMKDFNDLFYK